MKIVILADGYATRISEESHLKPKPMIKLRVPGAEKEIEIVENWRSLPSKRFRGEKN